MGEKIRVLILEDVPLDAELIETQLKREGLEFKSKVVDNEEMYRKEIAEHQTHRLSLSVAK